MTRAAAYAALRALAAEENFTPTSRALDLTYALLGLAPTMPSRGTLLAWLRRCPS